MLYIKNVSLAHSIAHELASVGKFSRCKIGAKLFSETVILKGMVVEYSVVSRINMSFLAMLLHNEDITKPFLVHDNKFDKKGFLCLHSLSLEF